MSRRPGADEILLRAVAGPEQGRSWTFSRSVIRIGRDSGCELVLEDPTVSRRHAELRKAGRSYRLHDTSAANPSLLNGVPGSGRVVTDADRIRLGDTELRVALTQGPQPRSGGPPRLLLPLLLVAAIGVVVMIVLSGGPTDGGRVTTPAADTAEAEDGPTRATPSRPPPREAIGLYELGKTAYHYGRLRDAREHLRVALRLSRGEFPDAQRYLRLTESMIRARADELLEHARSDLAALRLESAERALSEVLLLVDDNDPRYQEATRLMTTIPDRPE